MVYITKSHWERYWIGSIALLSKVLLLYILYALNGLHSCYTPCHSRYFINSKGTEASPPAGLLIAFVIEAKQKKIRRLYPPPHVRENRERSVYKGSFFSYVTVNRWNTCRGMISCTLCLFRSATWLLPCNRLMQNLTLITLHSLIGYGLYSTNQ